VDIRSRWIVINIQMSSNATNFARRFWLVVIHAQINAKNALRLEYMEFAKRNVPNSTSAGINVSSTALNNALFVQSHARHSVLTQNV
jgi:hypothetical protein